MNQVWRYLRQPQHAQEWRLRWRILLGLVLSSMVVSLYMASYTSPLAQVTLPDFADITATPAAPEVSTPIVALPGWQQATPTPTVSPSPTLSPMPSTPTVAALTATIEPSATATTEPTSTATPTPVAPPVRLLIPALRLDAPIVPVPLLDGTWDVAPLEQEIAHLGGTVYPGYGGNTVLAGHVTLKRGKGPFHGLADLEVGAPITVVDQSGQTFKYTVMEIKRVLPSDISVVQSSTTPILTLITCADWDSSTRTYKERLAVVAERVSEGKVAE